MKKYRKILRFQLKYGLIIALIAVLTGLVAHFYIESTYKEIPAGEFLNKALTLHITTFDNEGYKWKMETSEGRFYHNFKTSEEEDHFTDKIMGEFHSMSYGDRYSVYETGAFMTLICLLYLVIINIIVLWFVVFFNLLSSEFTNNSNKWIWFISLFLLPVVAPPYYLFISGKQKKTEG